MAYPYALHVRAAQLYQDGMPVSRIAAELEVGVSTVTTWLHDMDLSRPAEAPVDQRRVEDVLAGLPCTTLGRRWGIRSTSAQQWITYHGLHQRWASARAVQPGVPGICAAPRCAKPFVDLPTGRRRKYCSPSCKAAAHAATNAAPTRIRSTTAQ